MEPQELVESMDRIYYRVVEAYSDEVRFALILATLPLFISASCV